MKVTCCFDENDVSFQKSDVSFCCNRRVVFDEQSDIVLLHRELKICKPESIIRDGDILNCENTYNLPSRAHAYAHSTGVLLFLLSQVSHACR